MNDDVTNQLHAARALLQVGRNAEAARILRDAIRVDPRDAIALGLLAEAVRDTDPAESNSAARSALAAQPENAWVVTVAAWSADAVGDTDEAVRLIRSAQAIDPSSAYAHQSAAQLLARHVATSDEALVAATRSSSPRTTSTPGSLPATHRSARTVSTRHAPTTSTRFSSTRRTWWPSATSPRSTMRGVR